MAKATLKRSAPPSPPRPTVFPMAGAEEERWPNVAAFMTQARWEDGSERATATLLFFEEAGAIKVCLHDRAEGNVCFITGAGLLDCLDALEEVLEGGDAGWRKKRS